MVGRIQATTRMTAPCRSPALRVEAGLVARGKVGSEATMLHQWFSGTRLHNLIIGLLILQEPSSVVLDRWVLIQGRCWCRLPSCTKFQPLSSTGKLCTP